MRNNIELFKKAQDGDEEALMKLFEQNKPLVGLELRREVSVGHLNKYDREDLEQELNIALLKAIKGFDIEKGYTFSTYAGKFLRNTRLYTRNKNRVNKLTKSDLIRYIHIKRKMKDGKSEEEACEELGISEVIRHRIKNVNKGFISLQYTVSDGDSKDCMIEDIIASESNDIEEFESSMFIEQMLDVLSERDKEIIYMRFWDGMTQSAVAQKIGVSQMQISRIEKKALSAMRRNFSDMKYYIA